MKRYRTSLPEIPQFAKMLAKQLHGGEILGLIGPLGAGKTTFTKHLGTALGVKRRITSPTFTFEQIYPTNKPVKNKTGAFISLHHLDMYRLPNNGDAALLGLSEFMGKQETITVIEWADRIKNLLPAHTILIEFI